MPDITDLLNRWSAGDPQAFDQVMPLLYDDLKRQSRQLLQNERHKLTLNCTALVHEAYLRLVDQTRMEWKGRAHFLGAAAQVMRRILVEHARKRLAQKRGLGAQPQSLDKVLAVALEPDVDVVALNDALNDFAATDPESARVVELRCFGGLSIEETAQVMGTSPSSVKRMWSYARAWLYRRLGRSPASPPHPAPEQE
jgi:RNA polymerase sigma factor (TIGR02999 family)